MQVIDAVRASYGVENALYAVTQLAQVGGGGGGAGRLIFGGVQCAV